MCWFSVEKLYSLTFEQWVYGWPLSYLYRKVSSGDRTAAGSHFHFLASQTTKSVELIKLETSTLHSWLVKLKLCRKELKHQTGDWVGLTYNNNLWQVIWQKAASPPHTDGSIVFARWRQCASHLIMLPWPTRVHIPNGIAIDSAVFAGLTIVTDRQKDQTTLLRM